MRGLRTGALGRTAVTALACGACSAVGGATTRARDLRGDSTAAVLALAGVLAVAILATGAVAALRIVNRDPRTIEARARARVLRRWSRKAASAQERERVAKISMAVTLARRDRTVGAETMGDLLRLPALPAPGPAPDGVCCGPEHGCGGPAGPHHRPGGAARGRGAGGRGAGGRADESVPGEGRSGSQPAHGPVDRPADVRKPDPAAAAHRPPGRRAGTVAPGVRRLTHRRRR